MIFYSNQKAKLPQNRNILDRHLLYDPFNIQILSYPFSFKVFNYPVWRSLHHRPQYENISSTRTNKRHRSSFLLRSNLMCEITLLSLFTLIAQGTKRGQNCLKSFCELPRSQELASASNSSLRLFEKVNESENIENPLPAV